MKKYNLVVALMVLAYFIVLGVMSLSAPEAERAAMFEIMAASSVILAALTCLYFFLRGAINSAKDAAPIGLSDKNI
jgi:hypothetical protein